MPRFLAFPICLILSAGAVAAQVAPAPRADSPPPAPQTTASASAVSTPPAAAAAPVAGEPAPVDRLEQLMWQGAATTNTVASYNTYLKRYPKGPHAPDAAAAIDALGRAPVAASAPAPAPADPATALPAPAPAVPAASAPPATVPLSAVVQASEGAPFVCRPVFAGDPPYEQAPDQELIAYLQAIRVNSIGSYEAYVAAYPHGVFAPEVKAAVAARQGRRTAFASLGGSGPVPARSRASVKPTEADYPSIALRDSQKGTATAVWEIGEDGCVEACRIEKSSGSPALDAATCRVITSRGRYDPALNATGKPVRSVDSAAFGWALPQH